MATPIPSNDVAISIDEILGATGGTATAGLAGTIRGVATDTRADLGGKLFVALRGERFDGHGFVADAVRAGARAVLVERGRAPAGLPAIAVDDSLMALGALARWHRRRWAGSVVAVGGSAGKTTTRSTAAAALEAVHPGAIHSPRGNLNNRVGVPMVLLGLEPRHLVAVVEVGTNVRGEVAMLGAVVEPDVAVLTLVDIEHAAGIGTLDDIEAEEGDLLRALSPAGVAIANVDDPRSARQLGRSAGRDRIGYGRSPEARVRIRGRQGGSLGRSRVTLERDGIDGRETLEVEIPLLGEPGALAVAAAVAVVDAVAGSPVPAAALARALADADFAEPGRLRPIELASGTVVIDDTYNANPASVRAGLATAREIATERGRRLVVVLGEMRELGVDSAREHQALGGAVAESGAAVLVAVGGDAVLLVDPARRGGVDAEFVHDAEAALAVLNGRLVRGDVVLVKASRGVRAERVVEGLVAREGRAP